MTNHQQQIEKKTQIIRKDGKDCLVEINTQSFSIGRLQFVFAKYDEKRPKGQRTTDRVLIYMDFATALEFANSVLDGRLAKEVTKAAKKFEASKQPWDKDVVLSMGGTAKPKNRTDGKAESRILKAQLGTKKPIALIASSGPGFVNEKGLIVPEKGAKVDHSVLISLSAQDIREIACMIKVHVESYIMKEHMLNLWSYIPVQSNNAQNNQNNQPQGQSQNTQQNYQNNYQNQQNQGYSQQNNQTQQFNQNNGYNQNYQQQQQQNFAPAEEELPF